METDFTSRSLSLAFLGAPKMADWQRWEICLYRDVNARNKSYRFLWLVFSLLSSNDRCFWKKRCRETIAFVGLRARKQQQVRNAKWVGQIL